MGAGKPVQLMNLGERKKMDYLRGKGKEDALFICTYMDGFIAANPFLLTN
jgi:hypothetical protein